MSLPEAFLQRVLPEPMSGCWLWTANCDSHGYGRYCSGGGQTQAHIVSYEDENGPVPDGLELDHLCRVRCCVNVKHLEAVTHAENCRRGIAPAVSKTFFGLRIHCHKGHELTPENTTFLKLNGNGVARRCRTCSRANMLRYRALGKCR